MLSTLTKVWIGFYHFRLKTKIINSVRSSYGIYTGRRHTGFIYHCTGLVPFLISNFFLN